MKPLSLLSSAAIAAGLAFGVASQASATTFKFDWEKADGGNLGISKVTGRGQGIGINHGVGDYETVNTSYNDKTGEFKFAASFTTRDGNPIDGGWVVISDGPNPKQHDKEYAIMYIDGVNERVTAYAYNGQNNSTSYRQNDFLGSWDLEYDEGNGESSFSFAFDATEINARQDIDSGWKGLAFSDQVGLWFHAGRDTNVTYSTAVDEETGDETVTGINSFSSNAKWYDSGALDTESVPEPTSLLAFGLIGGAFAVSRRRNQNGSSTEGDAAMA